MKGLCNLYLVLERRMDKDIYLVERYKRVGVSPSFMFVPGPDKGVQLGKDELLYRSDGESHTTSGTMATAILNE